VKGLFRTATLLAGLALAVPAGAQSLTDALIAAYQNSNLLEQNRAVLRAADEDVALAVSTLRPVINFITQAQASTARVQPTGSTRVVRIDDLTGTLALQAEITLYDFGRNRLAIEAAEAAVLATREALVGVEQRVLFSAVAAFMDVRAATSNVGLREANVRLIDQQLRAAQDRFEVGEITRTDVSIAEARLAGARSQLVSAEGDLAVAREAYRAATGAYPGQLRAPPSTPPLPRSLAEAQGIARDRHPSIREAQHRVTGADLAVARAALLGQGSIAGSARLSVDDDGRDSSQLSLSYSRPVYTGGRNPALYRQAMAQRDAARAGLHQITVQVLEEVGRAWANLGVAAAQIEASDRQIEAAQTAFEGVRQEAELGARTTLDVLNAEQELLDARTARVQAETVRYLAAYGLLASMGLLTVDHLGLGIPTYDPAAYYNAVRNAPARSPQGEQLDRILQRTQR
jgi:outer membrane protein